MDIQTEEVRELLSRRINPVVGYEPNGTPKSKFWTSLTEAQKQDILTAYEESKDKKNLISREEFFKKR